MENLLQQLLGILVNPPGNLIYHLTLAFSIFASLQTALIHRRSGESSGRVLLGLNLILIAQLALFLSSGLAWQNILSAHIFLPVFDRAVIVFSLIWIGWLWAFPQANRIADILTGVLNLAAVILFFLTLNLWSREGASLPFNGGWQDWTWSFAGIAVMVLAITAVLLRRPNGWAIGFGMAALNLVGLVAHLFLYDGNGDFAAFIRLAQLAAFPLLPGLLTRQSMAPVSKTASDLPLAAGQLAPVSAQTTRLNRVADPRVIHPWIDLNLQNDPVRICTGVAHAVAQSMMADICYVVSAPADARSSFIIQGGYDLVREEDLPGTILEQSQVPNVAAALTKARSLRITPLDSRVPDLKAMADLLKLKEVGSVLVIPLTQVGRPWGGLILLSPYSNRSWTPEDQSLLASEAEAITAILSRAQNQFDRKTELDRLRDSLNTAARETEDLRLHNQQLLNDINALRSANTNQAKPAASADMEALIAVQQDTQEALTNLQNENSRLKNMLKMGSAATSLDVSQMENELRSVLQEVARLQNLLAKSNSRINELEHAIPVPTPSSADLSAIAATIQELRQPMSSIVGYTELLLAESIGILGKAQKKFLEHIRSSSERLQGLIDDMAKIISPGPVTVVETQQPVVNLTDVIDEAVAELGPKMRERGIQLHLDMPEELPDLYSDKDAIFQITNHLLQNAAQVTPVDGTISLRAHHQRDGSLDFIVLQVTDSGGGILPDDLPLIFTQRLRVDGTPIPGIAEDAVGLTVTKTLVDAIGGRIWVDAELGLTSTFTVLLPMPSGTTQESAAQ
jgi:signal transduction histidine kinase